MGLLLLALNCGVRKVHRGPRTRVRVQPSLQRKMPWFCLTANRRPWISHVNRTLVLCPNSYRRAGERSGQWTGPTRRMGPGGAVSVAPPWPGQVWTVRAVEKAGQVVQVKNTVLFLTVRRDGQWYWYWVGASNGIHPDDSFGQLINWFLSN